MSSCDSSCYTCFPKASSAFATSASSPTGGGPLSCHFAGKPSLRFSRKPNHQPPPPRKPDRFGSVPTVAGPWWSSRGLRRLRSSSVRHPFSPEPPHETTFPSSLTRSPSPPAGVLSNSREPLLVREQETRNRLSSLSLEVILRFFSSQVLGQCSQVTKRGELHPSWFYCRSNIATRGKTKCPAASSMTLTWQV